MLPDNQGKLVHRPLTQAVFWIISGLGRLSPTHHIPTATIQDIRVAKLPPPLFSPNRTPLSHLGNIRGTQLPADWSIKKQNAGELQILSWSTLSFCLVSSEMLPLGDRSVGVGGVTVISGGNLVIDEGIKSFGMLGRMRDLTRLLSVLLCCLSKGCISMPTSVLELEAKGGERN